jgi:hypothetical protein
LRRWVHCTKRKTSANVKVLRGNTTSSSHRTCDTVRAGAFFPHADFHVPQKEMREHTGHHVVMPSRKFAQLIVRHTELGFGFAKTLLDGPPDPASPDKT